MIFRKSKPVPMPARIDNGAVSAAPHAAKVNEPTYLGPDAAFEGNIVSDGEVHIDCEFRGVPK